ncbi:hypothetical protein B0H12DRAFT_389164 [Mycena haematopus]|nr:hypothetical protein B0H12DRAFT_389164 [Mycena haematopus]
MNLNSGTGNLCHRRRMEPFNSCFFLDISAGPTRSTHGKCASSPHIIACAHHDPVVELAGKRRCVKEMYCKLHIGPGSAITTNFPDLAKFWQGARLVNCAGYLRISASVPPMLLLCPKTRIKLICEGFGQGFSGRLIKTQNPAVADASGHFKSRSRMIPAPLIEKPHRASRAISLLVAPFLTSNLNLRF